MTERSNDRTYSDEEVKERLQRILPHWYLAVKDRVINMHPPQPLLTKSV